MLGYNVKNLPFELQEKIMDMTSIRTMSMLNYDFSLKRSWINHSVEWFNEILQDTMNPINKQVIKYVLYHIPHIVMFQDLLKNNIVTYSIRNADLDLIRILKTNPMTDWTLQDEFYNNTALTIVRYMTKEDYKNKQNEMKLILKEIVENRPPLVLHQENIFGDNCLKVAIKNNMNDVAIFLLENGHAVDNHSMEFSELLLALIQPNVDKQLIKCLLDKGYNRHLMHNIADVIEPVTPYTFLLNMTAEFYEYEVLLASLFI